MAVYSFKCTKCELAYKDLIKDLTKFDDHSPCPDCGTPNHFLAPSGAATLVYETKDKSRGIQLKRGQDKQLKERMRKHHDKYELADKIDQFGTASAERHGWYKNVKKV